VRLILKFLIMAIGLDVFDGGYAYKKGQPNARLTFAFLLKRRF
jgi:hypothetical protein